MERIRQAAVIPPDIRAPESIDQGAEVWIPTALLLRKRAERIISAQKGCEDRLPDTLSGILRLVHEPGLEYGLHHRVAKQVVVSAAVEIKYADFPGGGLV